MRESQADLALNAERHTEPDLTTLKSGRDPKSRVGPSIRPGVPVPLIVVFIPQLYHLLKGPPYTIVVFVSPLGPVSCKELTMDVHSLSWG